MPAVLDKKAPKAASVVEEQVNQAIGRIRAHDLTLGGLVLAALVLGYAAAMILLDKYIVLPEWVRQLSLAGFGAAVLGTAYWFLVRPLRKLINPLYAAVQVEKTIEDAKNSVAGYVEAKDREDVHPTVRAAMGAKAAAVAAEADVNRAVDHRSLAWAGGIAAILLLTLITLFFVLRLNQFSSLLGRAFAPFSSDPIATRTRLSITKPEPADATVTKGQQIVIAAVVQGKIPDPNSPDRVRVLIRHNPTSSNFEEVPMEPSQRPGAAGEWEAKVPEYLHLTGFYYQVAAGDARTEEHRVTVRTAPMVTDEFEVSYTYPPFRRLKPETVLRDPKVRAVVGTRVTVIAKTNREVEFAAERGEAAPNRLVVKPTGRTYIGQPVPGRPDCVQFVIPALPAPDQATAYQINFTAKGGEKFTDSPAYPIVVDEDARPTVVLTNPAADVEVVDEPANGQLKVDAVIGDDYGIDRVTLRMKRPGEDKPFFSKPYQGGKSFLREKDQTWPTDLTYKDSVDLANLTAADGTLVKLEPGTEVEFWLEATDNHFTFDDKDPAKPAVHKPNTGRSAVKTLRIGEPVMEEEKKQEQQDQKTQRQQQEQKHNQAQQQKLDNQQRPQPPQPNQPQPNQQPNPQDKKDPNEQGGMGPQQPMPGGNDMNPKQPPMPMPGMNDPMPPMNPPMPMPGMNDPMPPMDPAGMPPPMPGGQQNDPNNMGQPGANPPDPKEAEKQAERLQQELDKRNNGAGNARQNPPDAEQQPQQNPAEEKANPMGGPQPDAAKPKEGPKPGDPMNPENNAGQPSEPKGAGDNQPAKPAEPKPGPQEDKPNHANPQNPPQGGNQGASEQKSEPLGTNPGIDREPPKPNGGKPELGKKNDPSNGGSGKPSQPEQKDPDAGDPMGNPMNGTQQGQPQKEPGTTKPMPSQERGNDRDAPKEPNAGDPMGGANPQAKPEPQPNGGEGKPQQAPKPAEDKGAPKDPMGGTAPKPAEQKAGPQDGMNNAEAAGTKEPPKEPMGGMENAVNPGEDRDAPKPNNAQAKGGQPKSKPDPKKGPNQPNGGGKELTPEQQNELAEAAKDLNNPDPDKRKAAEEKVDKMVGKQAREQAQKEAEKLGNDLNSPDEKTREAAKQKLDQIAKDAAKNGRKNDQQTGGGPKLDPKDVNEAAKNLASDDPKKRDQAKKDLDNAVGEQKRKELEKDANAAKEDLKSGDKDRQAAGQKKLDELGKKGEQMAKDNAGKEPEPKGNELSKEEVDALAKKAADLNSPDEAKRKATEQEFDNKIGKENREKLQEAMKNAPMGMNPEQTAEEAKKRLEEMAKAGKGRDDITQRRNTPFTPQGTPDKAGAIDDDPRNRLKSAQLQLEEFKKLKDEDEIWKQAGITNDAERERFLRGREQRIADLQKEVETADRRATDPTGPLGPPIIDPTQSGRVTTRPGLSNADTTSGGVTTAPPGYEGAKKRFQENATKVVPPKK
jgi:hypothetical protein